MYRVAWCPRLEVGLKLWCCSCLDDLVWWKRKEIQGDGMWAKSYGTGFSSGRPDRQWLPVDCWPETCSGWNKLSVLGTE